MRKGQKNSPETIERMRTAARLRWASGIYTPEVWKRMARTYRRTYRTKPWKNAMTDPAIVAKVVAARRANGSYRVSREKREKIRHSMLEQFASGRRVSPFADPAVRRKSRQTQIERGHLPWNHSPEALASRAEKMRQHFAEGRMIPPMHYPSARKKISKLWKGRKRTAENRANISETMKRLHAEGRAGIGASKSPGERRIAPSMKRLGFHWQYPFRIKGRYTYSLDFAHVTKKLNVELDGNSHSQAKQRMRDKLRDKRLRTRGWSIARLPEALARQNPKAIIRVIQTLLQKRH